VIQLAVKSTGNVILCLQDPGFEAKGEPPYHPWWYGDCKSTHHGIKARYISPNSRATVEWLERNNFTLHNIPGVLTHFPRAANRNPSIIDLAFSRGAIKDTVENWAHIRESTSDHSIIGLRQLHNVL
jgi:hypothetical protein